MSGGGLLRLARASAWHRRFGLGLVLASIALATFLLLAVERGRVALREGFTQSISGTDLIVGARTGSVQLLLYSVFHLGSPTNTIRWRSVQALAADPAVAWVVPISLGDSHRGFPVVGTTPDYFRHVRHGEQRALELASGRAFAGLHEAVLGAEVAERLQAGLGQALVLRHGAGEIEGEDHADQPVRVVGVLARTGTPVDRAVHVSLETLEAMHAGGLLGYRLPGRPAAPARALTAEDLQPRAVTAALVGLKSRSAVFGMQRRIADFRDEPLLAVLPGVALDELWTAVAGVERALVAMGALVAAVSLAGLVAVVATGLDARRQELAVLRSVGAGPPQVLALLLLEGALVTAAGALLGLLATQLGLWAFGPLLESRLGLSLPLRAPAAAELGWLAAVLLAGTLASLLPGWRAYRLALADGLSPGGSA